MSRVIREIWVSDLGADHHFETNNGRRIFFVPAGSYPAGTRYDGSPEVARTHLQDEFDGGPGMRKSHLFDIPTLGADRLFIEFSGELVFTFGFSFDATANPNQSRLFFADELLAAANGIMFTDSKRPYTRFSPVHNYNIAELGTNSTMSNNTTSATVGDNALWTAGKRLHCISTGETFVGYTFPRNHQYVARPEVLPFTRTNIFSAPPLARPALIWGYVESAGGVDLSRLPTVGDQYGFSFEAGWSDSYQNAWGGAAALSERREAASQAGNLNLTVAPFETVKLAIATTVSWPANVLFGGVTALIVKGVIYAVLVKNDGKTDTVFIDRQGRVTTHDDTWNQIRGKLRT